MIIPQGSPLLLLASLCCYCSGYLMVDSDSKRQDLVPFPRVGRELWSESEKRQGLVPFPRVGRFVEGKRQGLIPFPRIGRTSASVEDDYDDIGDDLFGLDGAESAPGYSWYWPATKRMALTPRIGRKKRSTNSDDTGRADSDDAELSKTLRNTPWELINWSNLPGDAAANEALYQRLSRQMIPNTRVGRGDGSNSNNNPIGLQLRAAFIPRLGKKSAASNDDDSPKRAALTPRIGRSGSFYAQHLFEDDHKLAGRASFTPRIGRRAMFTPRIGRSVRSVSVAAKSTDTS